MCVEIYKIIITITSHKKKARGALCGFSTPFFIERGFPVLKAHFDYKSGHDLFLGEGGYFLCALARHCAAKRKKTRYQKHKKYKSQCLPTLTNPGPGELPPLRHQITKHARRT